MCKEVIQVLLINERLKFSWYYNYYPAELYIKLDIDKRAFCKFKEPSTNLTNLIGIPFVCKIVEL